MDMQSSRRKWTLAFSALFSISYTLWPPSFSLAAHRVNDQAFPRNKCGCSHWVIEPHPTAAHLSVAKVHRGWELLDSRYAWLGTETCNSRWYAEGCIGAGPWGAHRLCTSQWEENEMVQEEGKELAWSWRDVAKWGVSRRRPGHLQRQLSAGCGRLWFLVCY